MHNTVLLRAAISLITRQIENGAFDEKFTGQGRDIYQLGDFFVLSDDSGITEIEEHYTIQKYLAGWPCEEYCNLCAEFDVPLSDYDLNAEDEGCPDECRIWVKWGYCVGTYNAPRDGWLQDENGDILNFENYESAQEHINKLEEGIYHLSHGEHSRPEYIICEAS